MDDEPIRHRDQGAGAANPVPEGDSGHAGDAIVRASWAGTAALGVTSALGAVVAALDVLALVVSLGLFAAGTVAFFAAYARAVSRSRTDQFGIMSLFFLEGQVAPGDVRRNLLASFGVQVAVAVGVAALRPNTSLAFGVLAPVYGLALCGLWGARHGTFPRREQKPRRGAARG